MLVVRYLETAPRKNFPVENSNDCGVFAALRKRVKYSQIFAFFLKIFENFGKTYSFLALYCGFLIRDSSFASSVAEAMEDRSWLENGSFDGFDFTHHRSLR